MGPARKPVALAGATIRHSSPIRPTTPLSGTSTNTFLRLVQLDGDCESAHSTWLEDQRQHQVQQLHLQRLQRSRLPLRRRLHLQRLRPSRLPLHRQLRLQPRQGILRRQGLGRRPIRDHSRERPSSVGRRLASPAAGLGEGIKGNQSEAGLVRKHPWTIIVTALIVLLNSLQPKTLP
jgi:hypothetical protein